MFILAIIVLCTVASSLAQSNLLPTLDGGLVVNLLPNGTFQAGLVTIPIGALCDVSTTFTCHICYADCTSVHKKYGGRCGYAAGKVGQVCVCDNTAPAANQTIRTAEQECGELTPESIPIAAGVVDGSLNGVAIVRSLGVLCPFAGTGCNVDCCRNHQYNSGSCNQPNPFQLEVDCLCH